jgi:hypothetical protein
MSSHQDARKSLAQLYNGVRAPLIDSIKKFTGFAALMEKSTQREPAGKSGAHVR